MRRAVISEKLFNDLLSRSSYRIHGRLTVEDLNQYLAEIHSLFRDALIQADDTTDEESISGLYILAFSLLSLSIGGSSRKEYGDYPESLLLAISSLLSAIVSTSQEVMSLLRRGSYHPAAVLFRNDIELCFTLLGILIDANCREQYIQNNALTIKRSTWRNYFSMKALNGVLERYERSISPDLPNITSQQRLQLYSQYSSYAHNGYAHILLSTFVPEGGSNGHLRFSLFGEWNETMTRNRMSELNTLLFYTALVLRRVVNRGEGLVDPCGLVDSSSYELWDDALSVSIVAESYFLLRLEQSESSGT